MRQTDFDDWLVETFAIGGPFTILVLLVAIGEGRVDPLRNAHMHVMDDELRWPAMAAQLDRAGVAWDGVVFWRAGREGLVEDMEARRRLFAITRAVKGDRTLIREGEFFNRDGLRFSLDDA